MPSLPVMPSRVLLAVTVTLFGAAAAQTPESSIYPGRCKTPVSQRVTVAGCYLLAEVQLGEMSGPVFWHLYTYPTMAAAEAARSQNGTAVQSLGKFWVFTLAAQEWRAGRGDRVSSIGPLQIKPGTRYAARYMESILPPAVRDLSAHTHSGPEAFYIVSGAQCLETPDATTVSRAGDSVIVQAGPPMALKGVGTENRSAVPLVLHESTQPWVTRGGTWKPPGRCPR
jgi:mannose-6-phosphate isomerase-like protein (cupin superfamily)